MPVVRVPVWVIRGGTSKGVFFRAEHVPSPGPERDALVLGVMGSGDPRQIDGLGGADVLTSKIAIVGPSTRDDADVDYTFGQVGVERLAISWAENCGNISSAVGVFAILQGLVEPGAFETMVRVHNTNTGKLLLLHVPMADGEPRVEGDFAIAGVPGTGAEIRLDFSGTAGAMTGKILPTGAPSDQLFVPELDRSITVSIVDVANAAVFFHAADVGLAGTEGPAEFTPEILDRYLFIQLAAANLIGMDGKDGFPRPVAVAEPASYVDYMTGQTIAADAVDMLGRRVILPPPRLHKAFAATGGVCTAVASRIEGTVVHQVTRQSADDTFRLGHPSGVFPLRVVLRNGVVHEASFSRTARLLFEGTALVREERGQ
ncbi:MULTISPECIES: PrpF domain-containing protein [unclassified Mycobacterium]|uniref:PrpF domain-containing protein n=1 Tax=unclassified Mycobacterium TaxID=2642494 RepID=UPI0029C651A0|nr:MULTISPECIES: PrpF domain-containing protein [unclassified Mycobacterium]